MRHEQGGVLGFAQAAVKFAPRRRLNRSTPGIWLATAAISRASQTAPAKTFRLAPSDFAFLWEDCKRCFYLKAHKKLYRPRPPFPSIFGTIDVSMKKHFRGLRTEEILDNVAPGTFLCEEEDAWVECQPITPPGHTSSVYVRGMVR